MNATTCFIVILGVILIAALFATQTSKNSEGYYLRDIPFGWGFGGYPPGLYGPAYAGNPSVQHGLYGAPDLYAGYYPGAGLTW